MDEREKSVYMAKLAEQAERYEDMVVFMKTVADLGGELTTEERNLLSVAYKNVIGARRAAWRMLSSLEEKVDDEVKTGKHKKIIEEYKQNIEKELRDICQEIIHLLKESLIQSASEAEARVFFLKMKGDYYRYLAELEKTPKGTEACHDAKEAYELATTEANTQLSVVNPIRLGLSLNKSVFYYELLSDSTGACQIAKTAFDSAIAELDELKEDSYKDSTLIMQLLRDNLTLWKSEDDTQVEDVLDEECK